MENANSENRRRLKAVEHCILSERDLNQYTEKLDISDQDIDEWNIIVDLGAGAEQEFAKEMKKKHPDKTVISIDPRLGLSEKRDLESIFPEDRSARLRGRHSPEDNTVTSFAQELPFKSNSIDAVLALHSVPQYLDQAEEKKIMLAEIFRVLKVGGEARLYPVLKIKEGACIGEFLSRYARGIEANYILKEKIGQEEKYLLIMKKTRVAPR